MNHLPLAQMSCHSLELQRFSNCLVNRSLYAMCQLI
uniref:Uncharacterized protein n=1 Tax=Rhizophora mucronata TaxID=61149 RepID=A0A2P2R516_RHIMU